MNLENGGRIELRLADASGGSAEYQAQLYTAASSWRAAVRVGDSAGPTKVEFGSGQTEAPEGLPPAWLTDDARAALKAALRTSHAEGRWPRRITRWRPEPSNG